MYSRTYAGDRGKGAPPTNPKVKGYRRRYCDLRRDNKNPTTTRPARVTLIGLTEDLKGHIYDMGTISQAYQFVATTKALLSYADRKCTNPPKNRIYIEHQKDVTFPIPFTRADINDDMAKFLLGKEIDA